MKYKPSSPLQVLGKRFLFYVENTDFSHFYALLYYNFLLNRMFWKSSGTVKSP